MSLNWKEEEWELERLKIVAEKEQREHEALKLAIEREQARIAAERAEELEKFKHAHGMEKIHAELRLTEEAKKTPSKDPNKADSGNSGIGFIKAPKMPYFDDQLTEPFWAVYHITEMGSVHMGVVSFRATARPRIRRLLNDVQGRCQQLREAEVRTLEETSTYSWWIP